MRIKNCKYDTKICPFCGGVAKFPETGLMTAEKFQAERKPYCHIVETIDAGRSTVAYEVICLN